MASTAPASADYPTRIRPVSPAETATTVGAAVGSLCLVWLLYEEILPFSGVVGFLISWYLMFLVLYAAMAAMQWDARDAVNRLSTVGFGTGGALAIAIVVATASYALFKGFGAVTHLSFLTQTMQYAGPRSPLKDGGVLHAIVGSLEQLGLATGISVPLGIAAALFLAEVGGPLAKPVRTIVEAMTALPDLIAGMFIYSLFILSLGFGQSGVMASLAISVNMIPIVARASEVVIRLVPGSLREASYALGASQWRTVLNVVLPTARTGLATAVVLAMARGIGETAPVLFTAGFTKVMNLNPFSGPQLNLPLYIWNYVRIEGEVPADFTRGFGAAFVLVVLVLILFTIARVLGGSTPGQLSKRQQRRLTKEAQLS
ncbi:MAG TPA: phosphate ABC transporter permease PstA [Streptosporangiaceae bacterium]|nr:phosphate ABC transporter permease PstA [Streptosporangiaceae bacterium]